MGARQFGAKPEARRVVRRLVDLECEVYSDRWGEAITHRVTDVSEDGLWIQTDLLLEVGSEVTMTFYPPDWEEPLYVAGRVRRVELRPRLRDRNAVGMGIAFEAMRTDERRRLTQSLRGFRAQESFILDQQTLTGVPIAVSEEAGPAPAPSGTVVGWSAPATPDEPESRPSHVKMRRAARDVPDEHPHRAFGGGLDLATSVFARSD